MKTANSACSAAKKEQKKEWLGWATRRLKDQNLPPQKRGWIEEQVSNLSEEGQGHEH